MLAVCQRFYIDEPAFLRFYIAQDVAVFSILLCLSFNREYTVQDSYIACHVYHPLSYIYLYKSAFCAVVGGRDKKYLVAIGYQLINRGNTGVSQP